MSNHFKPSGLNNHFPNKFKATPAPFNDYIDYIRNLLEQIHTNEKQITDNLPFLYEQKSDVGVLLVHGLSDSPYNLRRIGGQLAQAGFYTQAILLPGHGTLVGDLLHSRYQEWAAAVRYGIQSFPKTVKKIYYLGYSTGGTLGIHYLQTHTPLAGLILLAPAIAIKNPLAWLIPLIAKIKPWVTRYGETDPTRYQSLPFNAAAQLHQLIQQIRSKPIPKLPIFMASIASDAVISHATNLNFMQQQTHPNNQSLIYSHEPNDRPLAYPEQQVIDISHVALAIPPDDPHYGANGDYIDLSHLSKKQQNQLQARIRIEGRKILHYGERSFKNCLHHKPLARLTFNPDFDYMMEQIIVFISRNR